MLKKILIIMLICSAFQATASYAQETATATAKAENQAVAAAQVNPEKITEFKYACDGLLDFNWTTPYDEIVKTLGNNVLETKDTSILFHTELGIFKGVALLTFNKNKKLITCYYRSSKKNENPTDYVKDCYTLYDSLNKKYGADNLEPMHQDNEYPISENMLNEAEKCIAEVDKGKSYATYWFVNNESSCIILTLTKETPEESEKPDYYIRLEVVSTESEKKESTARIQDFKYACDGLIDFPWSTSYADVEKSLGEKVLSKSKDSILAPGGFNDIPGVCLYYFKNNALYHATLFPNISHDNVKSDLKTVEKIIQTINTEYGIENVAPIEDGSLTIPDDISANPNNCIKELKSGKDYKKYWLINDGNTVITLYIALDKNYKSDDPKTSFLNINYNVEFLEPDLASYAEPEAGAGAGAEAGTESKSKSE